jgi:hypothetical protein
MGLATFPGFLTGPGCTVGAVLLYNHRDPGRLIVAAYYDADLTPLTAGCLRNKLSSTKYSRRRIVK